MAASSPQIGIYIRPLINQTIHTDSSLTLIFRDFLFDLTDRTVPYFIFEIRDEQSEAFISAETRLHLFINRYELQSNLNSQLKQLDQFSHHQSLQSCLDHLSRVKHTKNKFTSSLSLIEGSILNANEGAIGHVKDLLIDPNSWKAMFLISDSRNWVPLMGRHVAIPLESIYQRSEIQTKFFTNYRRRYIENSPKLEYQNKILPAEKMKLIQEYYKK